AFITGITGQFFRQFALTIAVSTIISAFNSLTLSPALSALLLKERTKGSSEALPRWAFVLIGAWLGYEFLSPILTSALLEPSVPPSSESVRLLVSLSPSLVVFAGAVAGWILSRPLNWLLGWAFRLFNRGFDLSTNLYTRMVGILLRLSVVVLVVYGG